MIRIEKEKLPKEYERVILEEYYNFFQKLNGTNKFFPAKPNFTTDVDKQKLTSLHDEDFKSALDAYNSITCDDIEFMLYIPRDVVTAIARLKIDDTSLHITEIVFLDYPKRAEVVKATIKIISECLIYGAELNLETLYFEIPKFNETSLMVALNNGFNYYDEPISVRERNQTFLLEKEIIRRKENERTHRRQQRNK